MQIYRNLEAYVCINKHGRPANPFELRENFTYLKAEKLNLIVFKRVNFQALHQNRIYHHHLLLPPWIRSFDLFRHRRTAFVSWGVHDPFFFGVCS